MKPNNIATGMCVLKYEKVDMITEKMVNCVVNDVDANVEMKVLDVTT